MSEGNKTFVGVSHTTISLICMSTIRPSPLGVSAITKPHLGNLPSGHLPQPPLRRLALRVLFTIMTTSYQTTCTVSKRSSIKGTWVLALRQLLHFTEKYFWKETVLTIRLFTWSRLAKDKNIHHEDMSRKSYFQNSNDFRNKSLVYFTNPMSCPSMVNTQGKK